MHEHSYIVPLPETCESSGGHSRAGRARCGIDARRSFLESEDDDRLIAGCLRRLGRDVPLDTRGRQYEREREG